MTCEPIDIVYFTLGTGNFQFYRKVIQNFRENPWCCTALYVTAFTTCNVSRMLPTVLPKIFYGQ